MLIIIINQESTGDEMSGSSSEEESEEPPAKKTPGKYKVSLFIWHRCKYRGTTCTLCCRCISHYSLDSEDDFCSGCWNVSHQQQFFSELPSHRRSHYTNYLLHNGVLFGFVIINTRNKQFCTVHLPVYLCLNENRSKLSFSIERTDYKHWHLSK